MDYKFHFSSRHYLGYRWTKSNVSPLQTTYALESVKGRKLTTVMTTSLDEAIDLKFREIPAF